MRVQIAEALRLHYARQFFNKGVVCSAAGHARDIGGVPVAGRRPHEVKQFGIVCAKLSIGATASNQAFN